MNEYFSKQVKVDRKLLRIAPDPSMQYLHTQDEKLKNNILTIGENSYIILEKMPPKSSDNEAFMLVGYLEISKKKGKSKKLSRYANAVLVDKDVCYEIQKKSDEKVIGYLKTTGENQYIAVTKSRNFLFLLWLLPIILAILLLLLPKPPTPFHDKVTDGEITSTQLAELNPEYFNIRINATPVLNNGKMNIRIENSKRNIYDCKVKLYIMEDNKQKLIYTSPQFAPNQSLEYATIEKPLQTGRYNGLAVFSYFSDEVKLDVTSSVKLLIEVR